MSIPLRHFAMVTYAVPPDRIRRLIPAQFDLDTRPDEAGREQAYVSVVMFENHRIRALLAPWPKFTFPQVNYRAYIRKQDAPAVWFFRVVQRSWVATLYRRLIRTWTYAAPLRLTYDFDESNRRYRSLSMDCDAPGDRLHIAVGEADVDWTGDPSFGSRAELVRFFTDRSDGYLGELKSERVLHMPVWHAPMDPQFGTLLTAKVGVYEDLGILPASEQNTARNVLLQPSVEMYGKALRRVS